MSYDVVIREAKEVEALLAKLGGTGRGLSEKAKSIKHKLTKRAYEHARFIAAIRNKVVHEPDFEPEKDVVAAILRVSGFLKRELQFLLRNEHRIPVLAEAGHLHLAAPPVQADGRDAGVSMSSQSESAQHRVGTPTEEPGATPHSAGLGHANSGSQGQGVAGDGRQKARTSVEAPGSNILDQIPWYTKVFYWLRLNGWVPSDAEEARQVAKDVLTVAAALGVEWYLSEKL